MKRVAIVAVLVIAAAVLGLWRTQGGVRKSLRRVMGSSHNSSGEARDEIRKNFELPAGARVEISGINGKVEMQTSETTAAEVYVLRTAKNSNALTRREVIIEQTATGLLIKAGRHAVLASGNTCLAAMLKKTSPSKHHVRLRWRSKASTGASLPATSTARLK